MGHDVILDDVRFDQSEDLSILSAANSSVSGFNLTENTVIVEIANHGTTTQSGFKAAYTVNGGAPVEETVQQSVAPGESLQYAFSNKVDVSAPGLIRYLSLLLPTTMPMLLITIGHCRNLPLMPTRDFRMQWILTRKNSESNGQRKGAGWWRQT